MTPTDPATADTIPPDAPPGWRHTSPHGQDFIERWEALVLHVYLDSRGLPTIGYGHLVQPGETWPVPPAGITKEAASALFAHDLIRYEDPVNLAGIGLSQNEFDALVSWQFNCGAHALAGSRVLACLRAGDRAGVPAALALWCHDGTGVNQGLLNRRRSEGVLFATPDAAAVHELSDDDRAVALAMVDRTITDWSRGQPIHEHDPEAVT